MVETKLHFSKRIERFFARIKQFLFVGYILLFAGGLAVVRKYRSLSVAGAAPLLPDSPIWMFWAQGEDQMPEVVARCVHIVRSKAGQHPVHVLDMTNFSAYVSLPPYVVEKVEKGLIDKTHFSDILRVALLATHGGIWMDGTLLLTAPNIDQVFPAHAAYWSCRHMTRYNNISRGEWTSFFFAAGRSHLRPAMLTDLHLAYWRHCNTPVDYLLLDYMFYIAWCFLPGLKQVVRSIPLTAMGPLGKVMNEPYSSDQWHIYMTQYAFHKLTYKIPLTTVTPGGLPTYYAYILRGNQFELKS